MSDYYSDVILADGPVGYWRLNDAVGSGTVADSSGNGYTGTVNGGVTLGETGFLASAATCAKFDGSTGYISCATANYFTGGDISVEGWILQLVRQPWARLLDFGNGPASDNIFVTTSAGNNDGPTMFGVYQGATASQWGTPGLEALGQWYHFVGVLSGTDQVMYVNGVAVVTNTGSVVDNNVSRADNYIGHSNWAGDSYYNGYLAEVAVYNKALTAQQVANHYAAGCMNPGKPGFLGPGVSFQPPVYPQL